MILLPGFNRDSQAETTDVACQQRRLLLKGLAGGAALMAAPGLSNAGMLDNAKQRMLSFSHTHTGETMSVVYKVGDKFVSNSLANISRLIDPALLDVLWQGQRNLKNTHAFEIISAYRSPKTNSMLRSRSVSTGVAKNSMHLTGQAIDIRLPGSSLSDVRDAALELKRGGVGYYASSDFVHLDTGRVRHW